MIQRVARFSAEHMRRFRRVHFIGIGGAGMSGIAEVMLSLGYVVSGSDIAPSPALERLTALGATVYPQHAAIQVEAANVVVVSSAIDQDNPEIEQARKQRIPVIPRAEMLAELMRLRHGIAVAGTHGKTTTTSLIASLLGRAGLDPTFVIGGLLNSQGANAQLGQGDYLVAEADESDASFLLLQPTIAVVTNIDADHLDTYGHDVERLRQAFLDFLQHLPFYGLAVMCAEDEPVRALLPQVTRTVLTYGFAAEVDFRAANLRQREAQVSFDVFLPGRDVALPVSMNLPGRHNVLNALAAIAVAWELGVSEAIIQTTLAEFEGIERRFNVHGEMQVGHKRALFIDDYGHHPTELAVTLKAARDGWPERRLVVVFQPHRYSRTRDLLDDFSQVLSEVDVLILAEVYAAGEAPIAGADGRALARAIRARGMVDPIWVAHPSECQQLLPKIVKDNDLVMLLGAGDIGRVAATIYQQGLAEDVSCR